MQGAVSEHIDSIRKCGEEAVWIRKAEQLETVDGLIIPGGESTTISRLLNESGMLGKIKELGEKGLPIYGTCAGLVLLAKKGDLQVEKTKQKLLGLMDMQVTRNAFGRQRESFEKELEIEGIGKYLGVFIRAPAIENVWGECKALCEIEGKIVAAQQSNLLVTSFHPELTEDLRVHKKFLEIVKS